MEQNAELRLPTIAVPVTLCLVGGTRLDGEVFVVDASRGGRDRLLDALAALLDEDALFVPVRNRVEIQLRGGARFTGSLFDSSPADRPRVVDHLNRARRFVRLWTPTDQTLINTARIESVSEQE